jgi:hypothetical protein
MQFSFLTNQLLSHPFTVALLLILTTQLIVNSVSRKFSTYTQTRSKVYWLYAVSVACVLTLALGAHQLVYFYVYLLGMLTAFAEIINKFPDEPIKAVGSLEALAYHVANGLVAILAMFTLLQLNIPAKTPFEQLRAVLVAGLGSMLIIRSKLFNIKISDQEIAFGPEQVINLYFRYMERSIDRIRAEARVEFVRQHMGNLDFEQICDYTITMFEAAQTWTKQYREDLIIKVKQLRETPNRTPEHKSYTLGFFLLNELGEDFISTLYEERRPEWELSGGISENGEVPRSGTIFGPKTIAYFSYSLNLSPKLFLSRVRQPSFPVDKFEKIVRPAKGILSGYSIIFDKPSDCSPGFSEINLVEDSAGEVEGIVYHLTPRLLKFLDYTEHGYDRIKVLVREGKKVRKCEAFIYNGARQKSVPAADYFRNIREAALFRGLSSKYIDKLDALAGQDKQSETTTAGNVGPEQPSAEAENVHEFGRAS